MTNWGLAFVGLCWPLFMMNERFAFYYESGEEVSELDKNIDEGDGEKMYNGLLPLYQERINYTAEQLLQTYGLSELDSIYPDKSLSEFIWNQHRAQNIKSKGKLDPELREYLNSHLKKIGYSIPEGAQFGKDDNDPDAWNFKMITQLEELNMD